MGDVMRPVPFQEMLERIAGEFRNHGSIFGIDRELFYEDRRKKRVKVFSGSCTTPVGPAAGPHTQLAQNIITSYLAGARFIELKTVQIMDRLEIAKPCIDASDECYNVEWSTEFTLEKAYDEYLKAWFIVNIIEGLMTGHLPDHPSFLFNASVGYDLKGIKEERMQEYIDNMLLSEKPEFDEYLAISRAMLEDGLFEGTEWESTALKVAKDIEKIDRHIASSVTISTMHGCPPDEIEAICSYMIGEKNVDTFVKLNPTLLGYDAARSILDSHGFEYVTLRRETFEHDLQKEDAFAMIERLRSLAESKDRCFGVKLTNTLGTSNDGRVLPGEEKYMSGRALFPLSLSVAVMLSERFDGMLPISFSGGVSALNAEKLFSAGIHPITLATDMLRPGGYSRMTQIAQILCESDGWNKETVDVGALKELAASCEGAGYLAKEHHGERLAKTNSPIPLTDCFVAPCVAACPIAQDIPDYIALAGEGRWAEALGLIYLKNALPGITGWICDHQCQLHCTRNDYEKPVEIREIKRLAVEKGMEEFRRDIWEAPGESAPEKAAVIGAGPAGLSAAYFLARAGFDTYLFEKEKEAGGVVRSAIPEFRIPSDVVDRDIGFIRDNGVHFCFSTEKTVAQLRSEGFSHIFVSVGASKPNDSGIGGNGERESAVSFLMRAKRGEKLSIGHRIVVLGGGNTAMDAARMAVRVSGVESVTVVYRRSRAEMPADAEEYEAALADGVNFMFLHNPVVFQDGRMELAVMTLGEPDASGRRRPADSGERATIDADYLITAIGEKVDPDVLKALGCDGPEEGLYIIGDAATGPSTVVRCMASARAAVDDAIDRVYERIAEEDEDEEECSCGHHHEDGEECSCGHHHEDGEDCSCGHHHEDGEECSCGHHHDDEEEELSEEEEAELRSAEDQFFLAIKRKKSRLYIPGEKGDEFFAVSEAQRCVECSYLCLKCVEVCPNRANVAIDMRHTGLFEDPYQILHLDAYCNECGNCATFCSHSGRPYKDKLTLFSLRSDFEESGNSGFYIENDVILIRLDGSVIEGRISREGEVEADIPEEIRAIIEEVLLSYSYLLGSVEE